MNKPSALLWMVFILFFILPTPAGKFIIDLVGGIFLLITLIPLILGAVVWIAWKKIQSKVQTCEFCGSNFLDSQIICPICENNLSNAKNNIENVPASAATIDIKSEDVNL